MADEQINISWTPLSYQKRRTSVFRWTILPYIILAIISGLSSDLGLFLFVLFLLTILFAFDYSRRLKWVRYALLILDTDSVGVRLSYYDYEQLKTTTISWQ